MVEGPQFSDRREAGRKLAEAIGGTAIEQPVVLALPRGGVPVAYELARLMNAPLDVLLVRKIGAPSNKEYGIGAVVDGNPPQRVLDETMAAYSRATSEYIERETEKEIGEIARRRTSYLGDRKPIPVTGRNVILVDDGIATGNTVRAAIKALRAQKAASITLAVPVAPREAIDRLKDEVDRIVCLATPSPFIAVGVHYADFTQVPDEEVQALLTRQAGMQSG